MGVGAVKGVSAVKWGVTRKIFWAWILTIPISALISAGIFLISGLLF
jgi:PiT family inorganic phosphate transporter